MALAPLTALAALAAAAAAASGFLTSGARLRSAGVKPVLPCEQCDETHRNQQLDRC